MGGLAHLERLKDHFKHKWYERDEVKKAIDIVGCLPHLKVKALRGVAGLQARCLEAEEEGDGEAN